MVFIQTGISNSKQMHITKRGKTRLALWREFLKQSQFSVVKQKPYFLRSVNWYWEMVLKKVLYFEEKLLHWSWFFTGKQHWLIQRKRNMIQYAILNTKKVSGNVKRQISSSFVAQQITNRSLNRGLCDLKKDGFLFTSAVLCTVSVVGRKLVHCRKSWEFPGCSISMNPALITPFAIVLASVRGLEGTDSFT